MDIKQAEQILLERGYSKGEVKDLISSPLFDVNEFSRQEETLDTIDDIHTAEKVTLEAAVNKQERAVRLQKKILKRATAIPGEINLTCNDFLTYTKLIQIRNNATRTQEETINAINEAASQAVVDYNHDRFEEVDRTEISLGRPENVVGSVLNAVIPGFNPNAKGYLGKALVGGAAALALFGPGLDEVGNSVDKLFDNIAKGHNTLDGVHFTNVAYGQPADPDAAADVVVTKEIRELPNNRVQFKVERKDVAQFKSDLETEIKKNTTGKPDEAKKEYVITIDGSQLILSSDMRYVDMKAQGFDKLDGKGYTLESNPNVVKYLALVLKRDDHLYAVFYNNFDGAKKWEVKKKSFDVKAESTDFQGPLGKIKYVHKVESLAPSQLKTRYPNSTVKHWKVDDLTPGVDEAREDPSSFAKAGAKKHGDLADAGTDADASSDVQPLPELPIAPVVDTNQHKVEYAHKREDVAQFDASLESKLGGKNEHVFKAGKDQIVLTNDGRYVQNHSDFEFMGAQRVEYKEGKQTKSFESIMLKKGDNYFVLSHNELEKEGKWLMASRAASATNKKNQIIFKFDKPGKGVEDVTIALDLDKGDEVIKTNLGIPAKDLAKYEDFSNESVAPVNAKKGSARHVARSIARNALAEHDKAMSGPVKKTQPIETAAQETSTGIDPSKLTPYDLLKEGTIDALVAQTVGKLDVSQVPEDTKNLNEAMNKAYQEQGINIEFFKLKENGEHGAHRKQPRGYLLSFLPKLFRNDLTQAERYAAQRGLTQLLAKSLIAYKQKEIEVGIERGESTYQAEITNARAVIKGTEESDKKGMIDRCWMGIREGISWLGKTEKDVIKLLYNRKPNKCKDKGSKAVAVDAKDGIPLDTFDPAYPFVVGDYFLKLPFFDQKKVERVKKGPHLYAGGRATLEVSKNGGHEDKETVAPKTVPPAQRPGLSEEQRRKLNEEYQKGIYSALEVALNIEGNKIIDALGGKLDTIIERQEEGNATLEQMQKQLGELNKNQEKYQKEIKQLTKRIEELAKKQYLLTPEMADRIARGVGAAGTLAAKEVDVPGVEPGAADVAKDEIIQSRVNRGKTNIADFVTGSVARIAKPYRLVLSDQPDHYTFYGEAVRDALKTAPDVLKNPKKNYTLHLETDKNGDTKYFVTAFSDKGDLVGRGKLDSKVAETLKALMADTKNSYVQDNFTFRSVDQLFVKGDLYIQRLQTALSKVLKKYKTKDAPKQELTTTIPTETNERDAAVAANALETLLGGEDGIAAKLRDDKKRAELAKKYGVELTKEDAVSIGVGVDNKGLYVYNTRNGLKYGRADISDSIKKELFGGEETAGRLPEREKVAKAAYDNEELDSILTAHAEGDEKGHCSAFHKDMFPHVKFMNKEDAKSLSGVDAIKYQDTTIGGTNVALLSFIRYETDTTGKKTEKEIAQMRCELPSQEQLGNNGGASVFSPMRPTATAIMNGNSKLEDGLTWGGYGLLVTAIGIITGVLIHNATDQGPQPQGGFSNNDGWDRTGSNTYSQTR